MAYEFAGPWFCGCQALAIGGGAWVFCLIEGRQVHVRLQMLKNGLFLLIHQIRVFFLSCLTSDIVGKGGSPRLLL